MDSSTSVNPPGQIRSRRFIRGQVNSEIVKDGISTVINDDFVHVEMERSNSVSPTMWLGAQNGW